jgi:hypothetical protein
MAGWPLHLTTGEHALLSCVPLLCVHRTPFVYPGVSGHGSSRRGSNKRIRSIKRRGVSRKERRVSQDGGRRSGILCTIG